MVDSVPLSDFSRRTTEITNLVSEADLILARRDAADLYLSTRERHDREMRGLRIAVRALAATADANRELTARALEEALPWMRWLPREERLNCVDDLITDLRAGAETERLQPFFVSVAAWESTAIAWADPEISTELEDLAAEESWPADSRVERPAS